jgi:hypothetical protein
MLWADCKRRIYKMSFDPNRFGEIRAMQGDINLRLELDEQRRAETTEVVAPVAGVAVMAEAVAPQQA